MRQYRLKIAAALMGIVAFFAVLGWAGDYDYCEQVILRMTQEEYAWVKDTLTDLKNGQQPTEREIAHWWAEHHGEKP